MGDQGPTLSARGGPSPGAALPGEVRVPTRLPSQQELDAFRQVADPLADAVMAAAFATGEVNAVSDILASLQADQDVVRGPMGPELTRFLEESEAPARAVAADVALGGQRIFEQVGPSCLLALFFASLPECYAARGIARVLGLTRRLENTAERRVYETAQMVVDALTEDGMLPGRNGVRAAQRVRLMHAAIRHLALSPPGRVVGAGARARLFAEHVWDPALGTPLNQEDLAYTLLTFSHVVPRSLRKLGAELSYVEETAWLATWNLIGAVMGVNARLLPPDPVAAAALFEAIKKRQAEATPDGAALTHALVDVASDVGPGKLIPGLGDAYLDHLLDEPTLKLLGKRKTLTVGDVVVEAVRGINWIASALTHRSAVARDVTAAVSLKLVREATKLPLPWRDNLFRIPDSVHASWTSKVPAGAILDTDPPAGAGTSPNAIA